MYSTLTSLTLTSLASLTRHASLNLLAALSFLAISTTLTFHTDLGSLACLVCLVLNYQPPQPVQRRASRVVSSSSADSGAANVLRLCSSVGSADSLYPVSSV